MKHLSARLCCFLVLGFTMVCTRAHMGDIGPRAKTRAGPSNDHCANGRVVRDLLQRCAKRVDHLRIKSVVHFRTVER